MKYFKNILKSTTVLGVGIALFSCGDEHSVLQNLTPADGAKVRFIHAAVDVGNVEVSINDKKFTGVLTVSPALPGTIAYGGGYPVLGTANTEYARMPAGTNKVTVKAVATATTPEVSISGEVKAENDKAYSIFAVGQAPNVTPLVITDNLPLPTGNNFFVRLVNLVPNSTTAELSLGGVQVVKDITFKGGEAFVSLPIVNYTVGTIFTGYSVTVNGDKVPSVTLNSASNITNIIPGRVITVFVRGLVGGTGTKAPGMNWYYNK
jgi:Domain of unknown function (DUF4397)